MSVEKINDVICMGSVFGRVCHHDYSSPFAMELRQEVYDLTAVFRVEVTCRFVGKNQPRPRHYGTRYGNTLLLAARQLRGIMAVAV